MPLNDDKKLSHLVCAVLDTFGIKKENVSQRSVGIQEQFNSMFGGLKDTENPYTVIVVGSSGEGIQLSGSDTDSMSVVRDAVCVDKGNVSEHLAVFEADYTNTAPGYTKVVSKYIPSLSEGRILANLVFIISIIYIEGLPYLSSEKIRNLYSLGHLLSSHNLSGVPHTASISGPAYTLTEEDLSNRDSDNVFSIYFYGGEFLKKWANRTRVYAWPSRETVNDISEMEGYIVPIGDKQSNDQNIEWRICYTTAERKLVSTFSDIQIKLYALLKMVTKNLLKPKCKALSSYVVKNVVFWVLERTHQHRFSADLLVNLIQTSLSFIRNCLENNHLPNYMIPERNLLKGSICGHDRRECVDFLSTCLMEGGTVILRIPKLYCCLSLMITNRDNMIMFGKWRDEAERRKLIYERKLFANFDIRLALNTVLSQTRTEDFFTCKTLGDGEFHLHRENLLNHVVPEWFSLRFSDVDEVFHMRLKTLLFL